MPPIAIIGAGIAAGAIGSGLSQAAANKGPQSLFPGLQSQALGILGGQNGQPGLGATALGQIGQTITNPGALPNVNASVDPAFQALYNANQSMQQQGLAQIREQFGASGLSASSPAAIGTSNYLTTQNAQFMNTLAQYTLQAQQLASQNQLQASEFAANAFLGPAFTEVGPKGSVLGAALGSASGGLQTLALLKSLGSLG